MAALSLRDIPILEYPWHDHNPHRREYLLWPVWVYRVVVPAYKPYRFNFIERAILQLLQAGIHEPDTLAHLLKLHPEMVRLVLQQLIDQKHIYQDHLVKESTLHLLQRDVAHTTHHVEDLVTGYIFQDAFSLQFLPRMVTNLKHPEVTFKNNGYPTLDPHGTHPRHPYVEREVFKKPRLTLDRWDVLRLMLRHQKARKLAGNPEDQEAYTKQYSHVQFVDHEPELMFLSSYLFFRDGEREVEVCDPFGLPTSSLRQTVNRRLKESPRLEAVVKNLKEKTSAVNATSATFMDTLQQVELEAQDRLMDIFGEDIQNHPVYQALHAAEMSFLESRLPGSSTLAHKQTQTLNQYRKLLEAHFKHLKTLMTLAGVEHLLVESRQFNHNLINGWATSNGYHTPLPVRFLSLTSQKIRSVTRFEDGFSLTAMVVAHILKSLSDPTHPFRGMSSHHPDLFVQLDAVIGITGEASHASQAVPLEGQVEEVRDTIYRFMQATSPAPTTWQDQPLPVVAEEDYEDLAD